MAEDVTWQTERGSTVTVRDDEIAVDRQTAYAVGEDLHERLVAAVAVDKQCPPKYLCDHCSGMIIAGDVVAAVDAGADGERTAIVTVARTGDGRIIVLGSSALEIEHAGRRIAAALATVRDAFAAVGREAEVLLQPTPREYLSAFHVSPDIGLRLEFSRETIAKLQLEQAPRVYQNPPAATETYAIYSKPTTNARGRFRRTKTKRCVKCNAIVNEGQACCHRCGSKRIQ